TKKSSRLGGSGTLGDRVSSSDLFLLADYATYAALPESRPYLINLVRPRIEGPSADRLRKALERTISVGYHDTPVKAVLTELRKTSGVHIQAAESGPAWNEKVTAKLENVPLSAVLQLLEDVLGDHRIVVRDYGLLI